MNIYIFVYAVVGRILKYTLAASSNRSNSSLSITTRVPDGSISVSEVKFTISAKRIIVTSVYFST